MHQTISDERGILGARIVRSVFAAKAKTWVPPLRLFVIAAFCRLAKSLSHSEHMRWLVGAVGIEPTTFGLKGRCSTTELRPYGVNP